MNTPPNDPTCVAESNAKPITIGELKHALEFLGVSDETVIKAATFDGWRTIKHISLCRSANEISLW